MTKPLRVLIIGAGNRGMYSYGELAKREDIDIKVVGVVEPDSEKREKMKKEHNIPDNKCFDSWETALSSPKFCDAVINTTPDKLHFPISMAALNKGYNLLLEKPIASSPQECMEVVKAQEKTGKVLLVAYVLRYAPFFQKIKEIIDSKQLGNLIHINLSENIGYWHFVHSYVRGNWRKKEESGPVILTKCCHDLDLLALLVGSKVNSVTSYGSLRYFKKENAPEGSTERCVDDCKVKDDCIYNAVRFYCSEKNSKKVKWPLNVISLDKNVKARMAALKKGPYGRCVYRCDNDVCDNQTVALSFDNGVTANFNLNAHTSRVTRKINIYFDKGELEGDFLSGTIKVTRYVGIRDKDTSEKINISYKGGHSGGDEFFLKSFVRAVKNEDKSANITTARETLQGHILAFAAEKSRLENKSIDYKQYKSDLEL